MLEWFIYPVSGVMRLWHYLLHSVFGMAEDTAWIISIVLLVVTVRSIIAPFFWMQTKSARMAILMRPKQRQIRDDFAEKTDRESLLEERRLNKELREEYNYNPLAGCVPGLIQVPVFLGLYQVLIRMAKPTEGIESTNHAPIGMLTGEDVNSFLQTRVSDNVPIAAYVRMSPEMYEHLNTTPDTIRTFILPFLVAACIFTAINMIISVFRNMYSMDHDVEMSVKLNKVMIAFVVIAPLMLFNAGWFSGLVPVAIIMYWVANNFWTFIQSSVVYALIAKKYPYDADHRAFQASRREARLERRGELRDYKRTIRKHRLKGLVMPWTILKQRAAIKAMKAERKQTAAEEKARLKEIRKQRSSVESELSKERMEKRLERFKKNKPAADAETEEASSEVADEIASSEAEANAEAAADADPSVKETAEGEVAAAETSAPEANADAAETPSATDAVKESEKELGTDAEDSAQDSSTQEQKRGTEE